MGEGVKTRRGTSKGSVVPEGNLYFLGDEKTSLSGGWTSTYVLYSGSATKEATKLSVSAPTGSVNAAGFMTGLIDLTSYNILSVNVTDFTLTGTGSAMIRISANANGVDAAVALYQFSTTGIVNFDISALNGTYRVTLYCQTGTSGSALAKTNSISLKL